MSRLRILIEANETNATLDGVPESDYVDWLRPLVNVILPGATIVALEIEGNESAYRLFEGES